MLNLNKLQADSKLANITEVPTVIDQSSAAVVETGQDSAKLDHSMTSYFHKSSKKARVSSAIVQRSPQAMRRSAYMEEQRLKFVDKIGIKNEVYVFGKAAPGKVLETKPKRVINFEDTYQQKLVEIRQDDLIASKREHVAQTGNVDI